MKAQATEEVIFAAWKANAFSFLVFILACLLAGIPFIVLWGSSVFVDSFRLFLSDYPVLAITLLAGVIAHEALHGLTWSLFCRHGVKSIDFGVKWKQLAPYAHCKEPLRVSHYAWGTAMPGILLGLIPLILAVSTGHGWILWFGMFFTAGAAGDLLTLWKLRYYRSSDRVCDHPDHLGFIITKSPHV